VRVRLPAVSRPVALAALAVALLAIGARAPGAVIYPLWQDEVATARIMEEPTFGRMLDHVRETESTPPAWYSLAWSGYKAGLSVEAVRWLSVLFGGAMAALTLVLASRFLPLWAAVLAGTISAFAWQLVSRGHELRAYALYALLSIAFALLLENAARRPGRGGFAILALTVALGLLTHYFFALAVATGLLWLWTSNTGRAVRLQVTAAVSAGILPALLWLPGFADQVENQRYSWVAGFDLLKAAAAYSTFFWNAGPLYVKADDVAIPALEAVLRIGILIGVLAGAVAFARRPGPARLCALLATVPVLAASVVWLLGADVFVTRNLLCTAPFACICLAALPTLVQRPAAIAVGAAIVALLGLGLVQERTLRPPPYDRLATQLVANGWTRADVVNVIGGAHRLSYLGDVHAISSPVGWYLPGHPVFRPTRKSTCPLYVIDGPERRAFRLPCGRRPAAAQPLRASAP
jgi:mannosyltransferase